jgi:hypothetical protein
VTGESVLRPPDVGRGIGYVDDFFVLLHAIDELLPKDAVLYLEGTAIAPDVAEWLRQREILDPPPVARGTLWPEPTVFHIPLSDVGGLRALAELHAEPEIADHLVVYRGNEVVLWAHDAGDGYVQLSPTLEPAVLERFRAELGSSPRREI